MKGRTNMKARLGIATAVVVGGGAIGVAAVATGGHNTSTNVQSSAYGTTLNFHHTMSEGTALSAALTQWSKSHQKALTTLAQMKPMRTFAQTTRHHTTFAAQRGVAVLATKQFLLVQSAKNPSGALHLWWLKGTAFANVSSNATGMVAMTGNNNAAKAAMQHNNMAPAQAAMAGSTGMAQRMAAPVTKTITFTVQTGDTTITITITRSTAKVTTPPATPTATPTAMATPTASATTQPVFTTVNGVVKGDMVFVVGERVRGQLVAKLILFAAPTTTVTPTPSASVTPTSTPTVTPSVVAPSGVSGTHF